MTRFARPLCVVVSFAAAIAVARPAAAQRCEGDCNGDGSVAINELILAVRIALGDAALNECDAVDRDDSGDVAISELVAAVTRALQGCAGELDESALVASARIAVEPIIRIIDLGGAAAGGGSVAGLTGHAGRGAGSSGCEVIDCFLFGEFTGSAEICCFDGEYSESYSNCVFDDTSGNVVSREGGFFLFADDPSVCSGSVPAGVSFEAISDGFFFSVEDGFGNFASVASDLGLVYDAQPAGCTDEQGFGVFGDGTLFIDGSRREVAGSLDGGLLTDIATGFDGAQIDVVSAPGSEGCGVGVRVNGGLTSDDFAAGTTFSAAFADFQIVQVPAGDALALDVSGTVGTDCVGDVALVTTEPLRLAAGDECITGGRLEASLAEGVVAVSYDSGGGLDLDFGNDGSVDQRFASCLDVVSEDCVASRSPGLCQPCQELEDCAEGFGCFECAFGCSGDTLRCSFFDDFAVCEDGVF